MIRLLSVFVGAALSFVVTATAAHAQANKVVRSGNYYEDRASKSSLATSMSLTFAQTPSDKFLNITQVTCQIDITLAQTTVVARIEIGASSGGAEIGRPFALEPGPSLQDSNFRYFTINPRINYKIGPARFPSIMLFTNNAGSPQIIGDCVIVGDLSDN